MSRKLSAILIVLVLASCGGGKYSAPRNLDNACAIVTERPKYLRAFKRAERRYGVPIAVQMAVIHQESRFIGNAKTPHRYALGVIPMGRQSSAFGYSQALDGTWDEYRQDTGRRGARRTDIDDATDFMGWYMQKSNTGLGIPLHDARNQYLAYHEGRTGYARGSYNGKPWLLGVAEKVQARATNYSIQLAACPRV
ncbi:lytic transglycosylase [Pseudooceanicola aestuarii]|uniref:transglycosylase SLT domain-containing protein n=1 Tax=Pseudooceanicola aestuarii TaxID=2697319 RepID=UPI0013D84FC1|nr:lytic transglycosylase [Pseudooceanicola aestuarii]